MLSFCAENTYYTVLTSGMVTELLIFKTKRRKSWPIKLFFGLEPCYGTAGTTGNGSLGKNHGTLNAQGATRNLFNVDHRAGDILVGDCQAGRATGKRLDHFLKGFLRGIVDLT